MKDTFVMKYMLLFFFSFATVFSMAQGQTKSRLENVVITSKKNKTEVRTNENGELLINVSKKDVLKFKASGVVRYSDFGAKGDSKTDDIDAIAAAHAFANQHGLSVKADEEATYYIGGKTRTALIQTDTDFGTAAFIIDDTDVQDVLHMFSWLIPACARSSLRGYLPLREIRRKLMFPCPEPALSLSPIYR
jgi:hypothetical protein